jgi:transcriptional regulator with XRE-family HTH domain
MGNEQPLVAKNLVSQAVRRLRVALGDTQQEFANRLGLAISTVVRYELTRPPRGKALAQLERLARDFGLKECALVFSNALVDELAPNILGADPEASGFQKARPQTPEEEAMVFDVLSMMREVNRPGRLGEEARKGMRQLLKATKNQRAHRIEAIEMVRTVDDQKAAVIRLSKLGLSRAEIIARLKITESYLEDVLHLGSIGEKKK